MAKSNQGRTATGLSYAVKAGTLFRERGTAWLTTLFWFALILFFLLPLPVGLRNPLEVISPSERRSLVEFRAPSRIEIPDVEANEGRREEILRRHDRIWTYRAEVEVRAFAQLDSAFSILRGQKLKTGTDVREMTRRIYEEAEIALADAELDFLKRGVNLQNFRLNLELCVERLLRSNLVVTDIGLYRSHKNAGLLRLRGFGPIPQAEVPELPALEWPTDVRAYVAEVQLRKMYPKARDRELVEIGTKIVMDLARPNLAFDRLATERGRTAALTYLETNPITKVYEKGELIAAPLQPLTKTEANAIETVRELERKAYPFKVVGIVVIVLACFVGVAISLGRFRQEFAFTASNVSVISLPVVLAVAIGRGLDLLGHSSELGETAVLFPSALVGLLTTILVGPYAGLSLVIATAVGYGVATGQGIEFQIFALFGGLTAVVAFKSFRKRVDVLGSGIRVSLVNMATVGVLGLFHLPPELDATVLLLAGVNGLLYAAATLPIMLVIEKSFGVVTDMGLLELTSPDNELMRMMEDVAPGSYQHSLNVTKLAESAAEAIGANYLLVRAGAYFHDIGKSVKPNYFSENQVTMEDKKAHSKLSPYMSVLIIKNHVKEGVEIARRAGLPEKVIAFIPQHHGTGLIRYFHSEAMRRYEDSESLDPVREEDFRYPGPKPQSIETAIVHLSDAVEAIVTATFTSSLVNENDLKRTVDQAVADRFEDGQFDECDLTMRDLYLIRKSFVKTLKARFHQRISYPAVVRKEPAKEMREAAGPQSATAA